MNRRRRLSLAGAVTVAALVVACTLMAAGLSAQSPTFDVTLVKANKSGDPLFLNNLFQPGSLFKATNQRLRTLITAAYQLTPAQGRLISGPGWIDSDRFDVEAKAEGNPDIQQKRLMLQALLADRFKLVVRRETRQLPIYALVVDKPGKRGPQLRIHSEDTKCLDIASGPPPRPANPGAPMPLLCGNFIAMAGSGATRFAGANVSIEQLSRQLSLLVDRNIVDRTGLGGNFDINIETSTLPPDLPMPPTTQRGDDQNAPDIFTALREQLGLRLEPQTGPVEVLLIDRVEQPSEN